MTSLIAHISSSDNLEWNIKLCDTTKIGKFYTRNFIEGLIINLYKVLRSGIDFTVDDAINYAKDLGEYTVLAICKAYDVLRKNSDFFPTLAKLISEINCQQLVVDSNIKKNEKKISESKFVELLKEKINDSNKLWQNTLARILNLMDKKEKDFWNAAAGFHFVGFGHDCSKVIKRDDEVIYELLLFHCNYKITYQHFVEFSHFRKHLDEVLREASEKNGITYKFNFDVYCLLSEVLHSEFSSPFSVNQTTIQKLLKPHELLNIFNTGKR